jgi:hypothetical protein
MPGFDRTGPRSEGPMTGGRRGLCVSPEQRDRISTADYGVGRGGRPYGGGRGRAWGGGYGFRQRRYWDNPRAQPGYPAPVEGTSHSLADVIGGILDRLSELGETVAALYDRFESGPKEKAGGENQL